MWRVEHPRPHFHARHAEFRARIGIDPIMILEGDLPRPYRNLVLAWASLHQDELRRNWELIEAREPHFKIAPLRE